MKTKIYDELMALMESPKLTNMERKDAILFLLEYLDRKVNKGSNINNIN